MNSSLHRSFNSKTVSSHIFFVRLLCTAMFRALHSSRNVISDIKIRVGFFFNLVVFDSKSSACLSVKKFADFFEC